MLALITTNVDLDFNAGLQTQPKWRWAIDLFVMIHCINSCFHILFERFGVWFGLEVVFRVLFFLVFFVHCYSFCSLSKLFILFVVTLLGLSVFSFWVCFCIVYLWLARIVYYVF